MASPWRLLLAVLIAACLTGGVRSAAAQSTTTGALQGTVTEKKGQPLLLVTVVVSGPAGGPVSEFTDASGKYFVSGLPPGRYTALFVYGEAKVQHTVTIFIGKVIELNTAIDTSQTTTLVVIKEKPPTIDVGSTKQDITLTVDYTKCDGPGLTRGRTYEGVLGAAPGAEGDTYGVSFRQTRDAGPPPIRIAAPQTWPSGHIAPQKRPRGFVEPAIRPAELRRP